MEEDKLTMDEAYTKLADGMRCKAKASAEQKVFNVKNFAGEATLVLSLFKEEYSNEPRFDMTVNELERCVQGIVVTAYLINKGYKLQI